MLGFSFETAGPRPAVAPAELNELDEHETDEAPSGEPERETTRVA